MASFGLYLKSEREKRNWTQTDFGAKIGINATAISRIENGSQKFSRSKLVGLASIFEVDIQIVKDLFYADKFATEALNNNCSSDIFKIAEITKESIITNTVQQAN
jgi:transcriptional regulator with XRE-family HTH domain